MFVSIASVSARGRVFARRLGRLQCGMASLTLCWLLRLGALSPSHGSSPAAALSMTALSGEEHMDSLTTSRLTLQIFILRC